MRAGISALLLFAIGGFAQNFVPHLTGEVSRGQEYQQEIGSGLVFLLEPNDTGWMIRIRPKDPCTENGDWASVVNAPYRNYSSLFVDASYGITAQEAVVQMNPRKFSFVVSCDDYQTESRRLNIVLWPYTYSRQEVDEATAKLGTSPLGKAKFTILDSRVSPAEKDIEGKNFGKIDWLRFKLDISPPAVRGHKTP